MRSAGKSDKTITTYTMGVSRFLRWCADTGTPPELTKANAQAWVADLLDSGAQSTTATTWLGALKRFGAWLAEEDVLPANPIERMSTPKINAKVTATLSDDDLKRLLKTCQGKSLRDRRDEAILRLMRACRHRDPFRRARSSLLTGFRGTVAASPARWGMGGGRNGDRGPKQFSQLVLRVTEARSPTTPRGG